MPHTPNRFSDPVYSGTIGRINGVGKYRREGNLVTDWTQMDRADFDAAEPLTLFDLPDQSNAPRPADKCGTPDLFATDDN